jgi:acyl-CoA-binding protein
MDVAELSMLLEAMEPREVSQEEFMEAVTKVKSVKKLAQEQQLILYGLFKQYTAGDVSGPEPEQSDFVAKAKWCES